VINRFLLIDNVDEENLNICCALEPGLNLGLLDV